MTNRKKTKKDFMKILKSNNKQLQLPVHKRAAGGVILASERVYGL